jgi:hypothetical protein
MTKNTIITHIKTSAAVNVAVYNAGFICSSS